MSDQWIRDAINTLRESGCRHQADAVKDLAARLAEYENVVIPAWKREEEMWRQDEARLAETHAALCRYGGHEDDCAGTAGYLDPRCTCGFSDAVRAADSASVCSTCNGSGEARGRTYHLGPDDHEIDVECPACFGLGEIKLSPGFKPRERTCHFCNGSGKASSASEEQA